MRSSTYRVFRRFSMRVGSISTPRQASPAMVAASGWAPPMPPRPAVSAQRAPSRPVRASCALRAATKVSKVPCTMPCDPM